jgi:DNA-directed RNA polymerase subunit RPC12/RpoP
VDLAKSIRLQAENVFERNEGKLKEKYGLTLFDFNVMLEEQVFECAICGNEFNKDNNRPQVDHDHKTGYVRGLLCGKCNRRLAMVEDDIEFLINATVYLSE